MITLIKLRFALPLRRPKSAIYHDSTIRQTTHPILSSSSQVSALPPSQEISDLQDRFNRLRTPSFINTQPETDVSPPSESLHSLDSQEDIQELVAQDRKWFIKHLKDNHFRLAASVLPKDVSSEFFKTILKEGISLETLISFLSSNEKNLKRPLLIIKQLLDSPETFTLIDEKNKPNECAVKALIDLSKITYKKITTISKDNKDLRLLNPLILLLTHPQMMKLNNNELSNMKAMAINKLCDALHVQHPIQVINLLTGEIKLFKVRLEAIKYLCNQQDNALGDLHANAQKLINHLVMSGMVSMPYDKAARFYELAKEYDRLTNIDLDRNSPSKEVKNSLARSYKELTEEIIPTMEWIGDVRTFPQLGDDLADRGSCDLILLRIWEHFENQFKDQLGVELGKEEWEKRYPTNLSDHADIAFINTLTPDYVKKHNLKITLMPGQVRSNQWAKLLAEHLDSTEENSSEVDWMNKAIQKHIFKSKLIHYDAKANITYAHVPFIKEDLQYAANYMQKHYQELKETDTSLRMLPEEYWDIKNIELPKQIQDFIELLNQYVHAYYQRLLTENVSDELLKDTAAKGKHTDFGGPYESLFERFFWRRLGEKMTADQVPWPVKKFVFGHDLGSAIQAQKVGGTGLDNMNCKSRSTHAELSLIASFCLPRREEGNPL